MFWKYEVYIARYQGKVLDMLVTWFLVIAMLKLDDGARYVHGGEGV